MRKEQIATTSLNEPAMVSMKSLSVVVFSGSEERRRKLRSSLQGTQANVKQDGPLPDLDDLTKWVGAGCEVLIVDLEIDAEAALDLVEAACTNHSNLTVMVCSRIADPELLLRAMRAGAREFLTDPLSSSAVAEALVRASMRRDELVRHKKSLGRLFIFVGAKGGSGTTTIAANFAVLLAKEAAGSVALVDLDLHLGDAALNLGLNNEFSTSDALNNQSRLDSDLLSTMLVEHPSGLKVLGAADQPVAFLPNQEGVSKLIGILRNDFGFLVVDAGSGYPAYLHSLLEYADKVYLVTQVSVVELRNCHRIIKTHFDERLLCKLEVVLNRYALRAGEIDEPSIVKALTVAPAWKVPSDFAATRRAQNTAETVASKDGPITRVLQEMARSASGKTSLEGKKRRFGLF